MPYIYGLRAKDSDQYFYIGSTKFTPQQRWDNHCSYVKSGLNKNRHFVNALNKVGFDNVSVDTLAECSIEERFELEYSIIADYLKRGHKLTNIVHTLEQSRSYRSKLLMEQDEYIEYVMRPDVFVKNYNNFLKGKPTASNPNNQSLVDMIYEIAHVVLKQLENKNPNWLSDMGYL